MAFNERSLDDYVDVPTRVAEFREKHPHGCLQPVDPRKPYRIEHIAVEIQGEDGPVTVTKTFLVYAAAAYRTPDDPRPGIGMAWEEVPGRTPYTRNSELMNAETSAWGRAILAVLAADAKAGIATRNEVANRRAEREQEAAITAATKPPPQPQSTAPAAEVDPACQALADLAFEVPGVDALKTQVYDVAREKGWFGHTVVNKVTGQELTLGELITGRKTDLENEPQRESA